MIRAIVFDWGDTIMRDVPGQRGPMAQWPLVEAIPGVREALHALHPTYHLALATNARDSDAELVRAALHRVGLDDCFDAVFTATDLAAAKPDVRFFRAISLRLGCRPEEVVMVGDDYAADVVGAKDAGWQAIWFNPAGAACPFAPSRHDAEVAVMGNLPSVLKGWRPAGSGIRIRRAEPSDAPGIAEVHVAAWKSAYRGLLPDTVLERLSVEDAEVRWRERLSAPWAELLVLTQDERILGYVGYGPTRDEALDPNSVGEVYVLYVAPSEWRRGHGSALLRAAVERLRMQGSMEIVVWVLYNNEQAIAFYQSAGFVADGARQVKERADGTPMVIARYRQRCGECEGSDLSH